MKKTSLKKVIRNRMLTIRDQIPLDIKARKDSRIRETLSTLPEFILAKTVLFYASFRSEVETLTLIRESLAMGKKVLLPRVDAKNTVLILYEIKDTDELTHGYMGIPEPDLPDERRAVIDDADLAIIPGAAFDLSGNRLGYGAGYYDILLSERKKKIPVVALAYDEQLVDAMPEDKHDVKVNVVITDKRIVRII
jgi:5-formyltetrahydrofolate cyclo-ligase